MLNAAKCHHVLNSITSIPQKFAISLFWFDKVSIVKTKWKKGPKLSKIYRSHKDGLIRLAEIWFMAQRNNLVPIVQTISLRVCLLPHPSPTSTSLSLSVSSDRLSNKLFHVLWVPKMYDYWITNKYQKLSCYPNFTKKRMQGFSYFVWLTGLLWNQ